MSSNPIHLFRLDDRNSFEEFRGFFENTHPDFKITVSRIEGECQLTTQHQGVRIFLLYEGNGEVFLPQGYRTQEGDGHPLPEEYEPDPILPELVPLLKQMQDGFASISPKAQIPVQAILKRWKDRAFMGDIAGELWKLVEQTSRPWPDAPETEQAIEDLFPLCQKIGYSTKKTDSWEPIQAGDQLAVFGQETLTVRGNMQFFSLENTTIQTFPVSRARRLVYLLDTAGGCSPGFDPFRRLPLTWQPVEWEKRGDGINFFNNHIVNIPEETSPTHFHPQQPIGGGTKQTEMYLVLDPSVYHLSTTGRKASVILFPDLKDLNRYEQHPLEPGQFLYIPPGTGHRGLNVFASIMTIPGFKPGNELYFDRDIYERTSGQSPSNSAHWDSKNFDCLDDYV